MDMMNVRILSLVFFVTATSGVVPLYGAQLKPTVSERRVLLEHQVKLKFKGKDNHALRQIFLTKIQEVCNSRNYVFETMHESLDLIENDLTQKKQQPVEDREHEQEPENLIQIIPDVIPEEIQIVPENKQVTENLQSPLPQQVVEPASKAPEKLSGFWNWRIVRFFKCLFSNEKKASDESFKEIDAQEKKLSILLEPLDRHLKREDYDIQKKLNSSKSGEKKVVLKKKKTKNLGHQSQGPLLPVGLTNFSYVNCYQNAVIQCLFHISAFKDIVREFGKNFDGKKEVKSIEEEENKQCVDKFISLLEKMGPERDSQVKIINPKEFSSYAAQLFFSQKQIPYEYDQEDAGDFLTYLLNEVTHPNFDKNDLLYNLFKVPQVTITECLVCNQYYFSRQAEFILSIEIPDSKEKKRLIDCLSDFCSQRKLEGNDQYLCTNCQSKRDAVTFIKFKELSPLLIIQLKRFEFDVKEQKSSKKLTEVIFNPDVLDMTPYLLPNLENEAVEQIDKNKYELVGVVLHRGTLVSGHYISFVRYPHENSQWIKCDDDKITLKCDKILNELAKTGTYTDAHRFIFMPYLLFYQKKV